MDALFTGIKVGITLSFLIGPIFFALLQAGVERGFKAGTAVGLGIWISDALFMLLVYYGVSQIQHIMNIEGFEWYMGIVGGFMLIGFGIASILTKPAFNKVANVYNDDYQPPALTITDYITYIGKGFLLNSVNPFTILFWAAITSTVITEQGIDPNDALLFFSGILGTIIFTDLLKVLLSKFLSKKLTYLHILWFRRISGIALVVFGIVLMIRVSI